MGVGSDRQGTANAVTWKFALDVGSWWQYNNFYWRYYAVFVLKSPIFARAFSTRIHVKLSLKRRKNPPPPKICSPPRGRYSADAHAYGRYRNNCYLLIHPSHMVFTSEAADTPLQLTRRSCKSNESSTSKRNSSTLIRALRVLQYVLGFYFQFGG